MKQNDAPLRCCFIIYVISPLRFISPLPVNAPGSTLTFMRQSTRSAARKVRGRERVSLIEICFLYLLLPPTPFFGHRADARTFNCMQRYDL